MKKSTRRRPEFESLESHVLLSTLAAPVTLNLTGTVAATSAKYNPQDLVFQAKEKGRLAPVGSVTVTEVEKYQSATATYTVATSKGNLFLSGQFVSAGSSSSGSIDIYDDTITGGTKAYARASGTGSIIETITPASRGHGVGGVSLHFVAQQVTHSTP